MLRGIRTSVGAILQTVGERFPSLKIYFEILVFWIRTPGTCKKYATNSTINRTLTPITVQIKKSHPLLLFAKSFTSLWFDLRFLSISAWVSFWFALLSLCVSLSHPNKLNRGGIFSLFKQ